MNLENIFNNLDCEKYFFENKLSELFQGLKFKDINKNDVFLSVDPNNQEPFLPEFEDLVRLHYLISLFKSIKVMEFGVGYSTKVIVHALDQNRKKYIDKLEGIRTDKKFLLHSVDSSKKYIKLTNKMISKKYSKFVKFHFSKLTTTLVNNKVTTQYMKLPNIRPDFIYIDGPSQWDGIKGNINGLSTKSYDRFPISSDAILFEYFLSPGTVIYIDGRTTNARFLLNNFQRNWDYFHFKKEDVHLFYLDEDNLGIFNKNHLDFIFEN